MSFDEPYACFRAFRAHTGFWVGLSALEKHGRRSHSIFLMICPSLSRAEFPCKSTPPLVLVPALKLALLALGGRVGLIVLQEFLKTARRAIPVQTADPSQFDDERALHFNNLGALMWRCFESKGLNLFFGCTPAAGRQSEPHA